MGQAMTEGEIEAVLREVTDEEVTFYHEYGWVMMKQLVAPEFATQLQRVAQERRDCQDKEGTDRPDVHLALAKEAEPYRSFMFSERMSHNAMRLVNKKRLKGVDVALRYRIDMHILKPPGAAGATYHQDSSEHGELLEKLAALVPPPRLNLVRYHGVLAPNAVDRAQIVPGPKPADEETDVGGSEAASTPAQRRHRLA